ncbi:MAG: hypothetical protein OEV49_11295 [candidate division Zixibacteria bacterium]|nr:hypothetical protein [candidate division Zixibacteria bacterium]MDH3937516.1 hypothetical protein [candidate division Zixibacteria bacterium]MDH4034132.1 hypothetical protein [candidate division Zixibacteria bacterium]
MTKIVIVCIVGLLLTASPSVSQEQCAIGLDHVDGLFPGNRIPISDNGVTFWIRLTNFDVSNKVIGITNGFEISGSDPSVTWNVTDYGNDPAFEWMFSLIWEIRTGSLDGSGADTLGFGGSAMLDPGMPPGWDEVGYWIRLSVTDPSSVGHQICLDSCWYPPAGRWIWSYGQSPGVFPPSWDGPHCFEIAPCCDGIRGNIDNDPGNEITISDLVYLVSYMFGGGPAPYCMEQADLGDDGSADITDLIYIVEYMFRDGPPPPACP